MEDDNNIRSYVDSLFSRAERAQQWEEYKFTPMYERTYYVRGLPVQNFGPQQNFNLGEVTDLVTQEIGTQNINFPFNIRMNLDEGMKYYTIKNFEEWGKFMEGTLGDEGKQSDLSEQEIYSFSLAMRKQNQIDDLGQIKQTPLGSGSETQCINVFENQFCYIPENPSLDSCFFQCILKEFELLLDMKNKETNQTYEQDLRKIWEQFTTEQNIKKGKVSKKVIHKWNSEYACKIVPSPIVYCIGDKDNERQKRVKDIYPGSCVYMYIHNIHYCLVKDFSQWRKCVDEIHKNFSMTEMKLIQTLNKNINGYISKSKEINASQM